MKQPYHFYANGTYKGVRWVTAAFADNANAFARKKNYDIVFVKA